MQPRQRGHNLTTVTTRVSRIKQAVGRWARSIRKSKTNGVHGRDVGKAKFAVIVKTEKAATPTTTPAKGLTIKKADPTSPNKGGFHRGES